MKNLIYFSLFTLLFSQKLSAQIPMVFNYQAVVRDAAGVIVTNKNVNFRIGITDGANGAVEYSETHSATTNPNGLVTLLIGKGASVSGTMSAVTWANGNKFIQTEMDITGGTNYKLMGSTQLLSVPYALVALSTPPSFYVHWSEFQNFSINQGDSEGIYMGGKWLGGDVEDISLTASSVQGISFSNQNQTLTRKDILESLGFSKTFNCQVANNVPEGKYPIYLKSASKSGRIYNDTTEITVICKNPIPSTTSQIIAGTTTCSSGYVRKDTALIRSQKIPNGTQFTVNINFSSDYPKSYYNIDTTINNVAYSYSFGKFGGSIQNNTIMYECLKKGDKFVNFSVKLYGSNVTYPLQIQETYENEFTYDTVSKLKLKFNLIRINDTDNCTFEGSY